MHIVTLERKRYKTITDLTVKGKHTFMFLLSLHVDFSQIPDLKTCSTPDNLEIHNQNFASLERKMELWGSLTTNVRLRSDAGVAFPCTTAGGFGVPFAPVQTGHTVEQQQL